MSKTICSNCSYAIHDIPEMFCMRRKLHTKDGLFENCHCFSPKSVFDSITQSPEVLAEKLVYRYVYYSMGGTATYYWMSTLFDKTWDTKAEAIAATLAKLKEVADAKN